MAQSREDNTISVKYNLYSVCSAHLLCVTFYNSGSNCGPVEVPACHLLGRTDKTHRRPQSGYSMTWPR